MTLTTTAWTDGGTIPAKYTQAGASVSPPLAWSNVPDGTTNFVLIAHDVDAAVGQGTDDMLHWMVWNIPGSARSLAEAIPQGNQLPDGSRQISGTRSVLSRPRRAGIGPGASLRVRDLRARRGDRRARGRAVTTADARGG